MIAAAQCSCIATLSSKSFCDDSTICYTLAALVGSNTCWVTKLSCIRHNNFGSGIILILSVGASMPNRPLSRRLDRCDRMIQNESSDPNGGNVCLFSAATCTS